MTLSALTSTHRLTPVTITVTAAFVPSRNAWLTGVTVATDHSGRPALLHRDLVSDWPLGRENLEGLLQELHVCELRPERTVPGTDGAETLTYTAVLVDPPQNDQEAAETAGQSAAPGTTRDHPHSMTPPYSR